MKETEDELLGFTSAEPIILLFKTDTFIITIYIILLLSFKFRDN